MLEKEVDNFLKTTPLGQNSRLIIDYTGGFIDWGNTRNPITAAQRYGKYWKIKSANEVIVFRQKPQSGRISLFYTFHESQDPRERITSYLGRMIAYHSG